MVKIFLGLLLLVLVLAVLDLKLADVVHMWISMKSMSGRIQLGFIPKIYMPNPV